MRVKIDVVVLQDPCSACFIIGGLVQEMLAKLRAEFDFLDIHTILLQDLKNLHRIEGLEVESFPAIIINGEQITAGTLPNKKELIARIKWEAENSEC